MTVSGTLKASYILHSFLAAGGQDSDKSGLITYTGICKNCAVPSLHRDSFVANETGPCPVLRRVTLAKLYRRAVSTNAPGKLASHRNLTNF